MECIELQSDIQLKNLIMSLYQTFIRPLLTEKNIPYLPIIPYSWHLFFGSKNICEQLFLRMKHRKSKISSNISDEHLESSLRIAATAIEPEWCKVVASQPNVV